MYANPRWDRPSVERAARIACYFNKPNASYCLVAPKSLSNAARAHLIERHNPYHRMAFSLFLSAALVYAMRGVLFHYCSGTVQRNGLFDKFCGMIQPIMVRIIEDETVTWLAYTGENVKRLREFKPLARRMQGFIGSAASLHDKSAETTKRMDNQAAKGHQIQSRHFVQADF